MEKKGISQETLKLIACVTMLLDHIGALFFRGFELRIIGRLAFPIYVFLLVEGIHYTKNPIKYGIRLFIGILLAEIPFDYALKKGFSWGSQSVMITLFLGFVAVELIQLTENGVLKVLICAAFFGIAEWARTDYGGQGVLLIVLFSQTRGELWMQTVILAMVAWMMNSLRIDFLGYKVPIEMFALFAMVPISCYNGKKLTNGKAVQWAFYLFYPVHLAVLALLRIYFR